MRFGTPYVTTKILPAASHWTKTLLHDKEFMKTQSLFTNHANRILLLENKMKLFHAFSGGNKNC
jgi:hypothetical protein